MQLMVLGAQAHKLRLERQRVPISQPAPPQDRRLPSPSPGDMPQISLSAANHQNLGKFLWLLKHLMSVL